MPSIWWGCIWAVLTGDSRQITSAPVTCPPFLDPAVYIVIALKRVDLSMGKEQFAEEQIAFAPSALAETDATVTEIVRKLWCQRSDILTVEEAVRRPRR